MNALNTTASPFSVLWQKLGQTPGEATLWLELARHYADGDWPWQAGYAARQTVRLDATLISALPTARIGAWQDPSFGDAVLGRAHFPQAMAMTERFAAQSVAHPGDWLTWLYLARLHEMAASPDAPPARVARDQAQRLEYLPGEALHWLGVWRLNAGDEQGAVVAFSALSNSQPRRFGSMMYLGEALLRVGQVAEAQQAFSLASQSNNPEFLVTLSARVYGHNYWQEAIDILKKAHTLRPDSVPILLQLARIQSEVYDLADCRATLRQARELAPDNPEVRLLEAGLQGRMGDAHGHLATLQTVYAAGGDPLSRLASGIAMTALYHDGLTPLQVADLHRSVCAPIEQAVTRTTDFVNPRTTDRRLRLGCVTGDLHRQHPVNIFFLPVLQHLDHTSLTIFVYHTGTMHDEYTRQAKACVDHWVEASGMDDRALHQTIVADRIDMLLDLAGHTSSHRLGVFAMRAAPVQATFLGYPHSTGLSTMDWLIGDAMVSPAEDAGLFSEGLAQLPNSVFCWAPVDEYPLPRPRSTDAPVVFGSFNNAMKLSPSTVHLWARVLHAVPDSRLLLKAPSLRDAAVQASMTERFAGHGIDATRLLFRGPSGLAEMMQEYGDLDIALDPTPYNGGTTTLQALWMGVPVVTLAGGNFVGRMGASFLHTLGQPDWVASDAEGYIRIAAALANSLNELRGARSRLRQQMSASPLCHIKNYTKDMESLWHAMWATWCRGERPGVIRIENRPNGQSSPPAPTTAPSTPCNSGRPSGGRLPIPETAHPPLDITTSRHMLSWLAEQNLSIVLTTYQIGKLFLLGRKANGALSVFERTFNRCMGLCPTDNGFCLSTLFQVWRFENLFTPGYQQDGYDRLYIPQVAHTTGDLDIHDMALDADNRLVFVNTLFGCLATLSDTHSFKPLWRPPFISRLAAEDRCHLNGLAMKDGRPAFVTAVGVSDVADGWREQRADGGVVVEVAGNEIVATGLSMPHSPRWYLERLWLLNSGTGEFGYVESETGRFVPLTFCAGYLRGLSFHGHYALVGLSLPRHNRTFSGLPLDEKLKARHVEPRCGIQVIDLHTGDTVHWLRMEGLVSEIYDVITLPGVRKPMALGLVTDEIQRVISMDG
ncbi:MAG: TIGR03032 family protein [Magnetococcus sp. YQC-9]